MIDLVSIDPGKIVSGVAHWQEGELIGAGLQSRAPDDADPVRDCVLEYMEVRPGRSGSVPKDLIAVATAGAYLMGTYRPRAFVMVSPTQWKGQTPKDIHHERMRLALLPWETHVLGNALRDAPKPHHKEILDAVALGLFYLGRIGRSGARL